MYRCWSRFEVIDHPVSQAEILPLFISLPDGRRGNRFVERSDGLNSGGCHGGGALKFWRVPGFDAAQSRLIEHGWVLRRGCGRSRRRWHGKTLHVCVVMLFEEETKSKRVDTGRISASSDSFPRVPPPFLLTDQPQCQEPPHATCQPRSKLVHPRVICMGANSNASQEQNVAGPSNRSQRSHASAEEASHFGAKTSWLKLRRTSRDGSSRTRWSGDVSHRCWGGGGGLHRPRNIAISILLRQSASFLWLSTRSAKRPQ